MATSGGSEALGVIALVAGSLAAIFGWVSGKAREVKENAFNRELTKELQDRSTRLDWRIEDANGKLARQVDDAERELRERMKYLTTMREEFEASYIGGRKWLAHFIADADRRLDEEIARNLRNKSHPALKAAEQVTVARAERREFKELVKFLEYQLKSYKEYFPFLEEYDHSNLESLHDFTVTHVGQK